MIPKDPVMLLSFMNMKLRDHYSSLEALSDDMDISESELTEQQQADCLFQPAAPVWC